MAPGPSSSWAKSPPLRPLKQPQSLSQSQRNFPRPSKNRSCWPSPKPRNPPPTHAHTQHIKLKLKLKKTKKITTQKPPDPQQPSHFLRHGHSLRHPIPSLALAKLRHSIPCPLRSYEIHQCFTHRGYCRSFPSHTAQKNSHPAPIHRSPGNGESLGRRGLHKGRESS